MKQEGEVMTKKPKRLSTEEYQRRDIPIKCNSCRRWMARRLRKSGHTVTALRRDVPHAGECRDCKPSATSVHGCEGCKECAGFMVVLGSVVKR